MTSVLLIFKDIIGPIPMIPYSSFYAAICGYVPKFFVCTIVIFGKIVEDKENSPIGETLGKDSSVVALTLNLKKLSHPSVLSYHIKRLFS
jgi:hypothetical protein